MSVLFVVVPLQRSEGKRRAADCPLGLLRILEGYLTYDNDQVRTYINGTTYSVLSIPALRVSWVEGGGRVFAWDGAKAQGQSCGRRGRECLIDLPMADASGGGPRLWSA
jgi:hypothetical protein